MTKQEREKLIQEGRNQVLYLLLCIGDENVVHDDWHPEKAETLLEARREIIKRLRTQEFWPRQWPDFEKYTYRPG